MISITGQITKDTIFPEEKLGSTDKNQSYPPTGTHPSPISVLVWRSTNSSGSSSSTSKLTLCTHWLLMANITPPHWVVTSGKSWLVPKAHYRKTATKKGSMSFVVRQDILKPELALLATAGMSVTRATQGSDLAQAGALTFQTRAVTWPVFLQIMDTKKSRPWDTSWYNKYDSVFAKKKKLIISLMFITQIFLVSSATPRIGTYAPLNCRFTLDQSRAILSTKSMKINLRYQVEHSFM